MTLLLKELSYHGLYCLTFYLLDALLLCKTKVFHSYDNNNNSNNF